MPQVNYRGRRAVQIENDLVRVTVTVEGGHIAEIFHKPSGVNPLWSPNWPSIEPSSYDPVRHPEYGGGVEAQLLSGILGHNICLDTFGPPSAEEAQAGMPVHGEAAVVTYSVSEGPDFIVLETTLAKAQLRFKRRISMLPASTVISVSEELENLSASDRPIAWTQHVTLGEPFLQRGSTQFRASATRSKVIGASFNDGMGMQQADAEFDWPLCPRKDGGVQDLSSFPGDEVSAGFSAHLMDPEEEQAWFLAWSPHSKVVIGYLWQRTDFPWLARWEENHLRTDMPWNGGGFACGMEFGVSPMAESRREMISRGSLFGVPSYRWIPARSTVRVTYCAFITTADVVPETVTQDAAGSVVFRS